MLQQSGNHIRQEIRDALQKATKEEASNLENALNILKKAAQLVPLLHMEEEPEKSSTESYTPFENIWVIYYSKKGNLHYEICEYSEALFCFEEVRQRLIYDNNKVHKVLGDVLRKLKRYDEALKSYDYGLDVYEAEAEIIPNLNDKATLLNSKGLTFQEYNKRYDEAIKCFDEAIKAAPKNPLYLLNKGQALYAKDPSNLSYMDWFNKAHELSKKGTPVPGLQQQDMNFINNSLNKFLENLKILKELNVQDDFFADREKHFVKDGISMITEMKKVEGELVIDSKKKFQEIRKQPNLFQFYQGFMHLMTRSYDTAVSIDSGAFRLNNQSYLTKSTKFLFKMIPLVGSQISAGLGAVATFIKEAKIKGAAANIANFAKDQEEFKSIALDAIVQIILERQEKINSLQKVENAQLSTWRAPYKKMVKNHKKAERWLYGKQIETPMQKVGLQTAAILCSEWIASGEIYNGQFATELYPDEKVKRLKNYGLELLDEGIEKIIQKQEMSIINIKVDDSKGESISKPTSRDSQHR